MTITFCLTNNAYNSNMTMAAKLHNNSLQYTILANITLPYWRLQTCTSKETLLV